MHAYLEVFIAYNYVSYVYNNTLIKPIFVSNSRSILESVQCIQKMGQGELTLSKMWGDWYSHWMALSKLGGVRGACAQMQPWCIFTVSTSLVHNKPANNWVQRQKTLMTFGKVEVLEVMIGMRVEWVKVGNQKSFLCLYTEGCKSYQGRWWKWPACLSYRNQLGGSPPSWSWTGSLNVSGKIHTVHCLSYGSQPGGARRLKGATLSHHWVCDVWPGLGSLLWRLECATLSHHWTCNVSPSLKGRLGWLWRLGGATLYHHWASNVSPSLGGWLGWLWRLGGVTLSHWNT